MLTGSAGTFGFSRAFQLARELERQLEGDAPLEPGDLPRLAADAASLGEHLRGEPGAGPKEGPAGQEPAPTREDGPALLVASEPALAERLAAEANAGAAGPRMCRRSPRSRMRCAAPEPTCSSSTSRPPRVSGKRSKCS